MYVIRAFCTFGLQGQRIAHHMHPTLHLATLNYLINEPALINEKGRIALPLATQPMLQRQPNRRVKIYGFLYPNFMHIPKIQAKNPPLSPLTPPLGGGGLKGDFFYRVVTVEELFAYVFGICIFGYKNPSILTPCNLVDVAT